VLLKIHTGNVWTFMVCAEHDMRMHPPSKFAEVAEKSRAKRAKLNATTATREAKRVKDGEEERAVRSARFPGTSKYKDRDTGAISGQDEPTLHAFVENEEKT
jgi:hypothetical protein